MENNKKFFYIETWGCQMNEVNKIFKASKIAILDTLKIYLNCS